MLQDCEEFLPAITPQELNVINLFNTHVKHSFTASFRCCGIYSSKKVQVLQRKQNSTWLTGYVEVLFGPMWPPPLYTFKVIIDTW
jgi:hypothetical protein